MEKSISATERVTVVARWDSERLDTTLPPCPWCLSGDTFVVTKHGREYVYHRTLSDFCPLHGSDSIELKEWSNRGKTGVAAKPPKD